MRVTGVSIIKNATKYDFPIMEALRSIQPLCDEIIVAVGDSEDDTRDRIASLGDHIHIVDTVWDEQLYQEGKVLADETNKALRAAQGRSDWIFYIQGDEVLHEAYIPAVKAAMQRYADDAQVDGLLFSYQHFYGSYDYIGDSAQWYRHEIRIIKNRSDIYSYRDAQGFRKGSDQKLRVVPIDAAIYHYGWVKAPDIMLDKLRNDHRVRSGADGSAVPTVADGSAFDYGVVDRLARFAGSHPAVMDRRIQQRNWSWDFDISMNRMTLKERLKRWTSRLFGRPIGEYRNYKVIRR